MQNKTPLIALTEVTKRYKNAIEPTVKGISLDVFSGEIFGLLGPNGAGKTTTISMICGLFSADHGSITINGLDVQRDFEQIKKILGVVPQDIALFDNLNAWENLRFFGRMYGLSEGGIAEGVDYYLNRFGMKAHANKRVKYFSGGMKRRINLIAALLHQPKLLILDEPTVGVDVQSRHVILSFLKELNQKGVTILYTSHLLEEAQDLCSRVAIIDSGRLLSEGTPGDLIAATPGVDNLQGYFLQLTGDKLRD